MCTDGCSNDYLPAAMAQRLADRFEVFYTPKCGSWLNQIELDFSAFSRQCLKRRIPTQAQLAYQVYCWSRERQVQGINIHWQFTVTHARPSTASIVNSRRVIKYIRKLPEQVSSSGAEVTA